MPILHGVSFWSGARRGRLTRRASIDPGARRRKRMANRRPRRPLGSAVLHAPQVLRALVRADEIWLVVLAAFLGCATGIMVWLMTATTQLIHEALFLISPSQRLSAMSVLDPVRTVLVPALGGVFLG